MPENIIKICILAFFFYILKSWREETYLRSVYSQDWLSRLFCWGFLGGWGWVLIEINITPNLLYGNSGVHFKCMQNPGIYWLLHYSTSEWKENKLLNNSEEHWNTFTWQSTLMVRELFSLWFKWKRRFLMEQLWMFKKCTANVKQHLICIFYLCCVFVLSQQYKNVKTLKLSLNSKLYFPFLSDFTEISYEVNHVIIAYIFHVRHCTLMC